MYRISEIISLPIINIYQGKQEGIIDNIYIDTKTKKFKFMSISDDDTGLQYRINLNDIYLIGNDCVLIKNSSALELLDSTSNQIEDYVSPINLNIYNLNGQTLGKCIDTIMDKKYNLKSVTTSTNQEIFGDTIKNIGQTTILISDQAFNLNKFKPNTTIIKTSSSSNLIVTLPNQIIQAQNSTQQKILTDYTFLLGRFLTNNVQSFNGEIIAKEGSKITKDVIKRASLVGKLLELTRYSTKKELT